MLLEGIHCCGDPIIAKIDEEKIPIYSMFHDNWSSLQIISDSLDQFIIILKKLKETNLKDKAECEKILEDIKKSVPDISFDYWENLIIDF